MAKKTVNTKTVHRFVEEILGDHLHAKRVASLADAAVGAMHGATLSVHAIGLGLAGAKSLTPKHAIKQVDRLLSNAGIDLARILYLWIPFVLGARKEALIALDWTDFDKDDQTTVCAYLVTSHGRATPLVWRTVRKSEIKDRRNDHEDDLLTLLRAAIADDVRVTILADRGFADQKLFAFLKELAFDYIIRFRQATTVTNATGESRPALDWLSPSGRARLLRGATITRDQFQVPAVVVVRARGMKEAWCLVASDERMTAQPIVKRYGRRFTIEESFRDAKDLRFGMGLSATRIKNPQRRDRMLLLGAIVVALLTLLGAAGEDAGFGKYMKANTSKKRTYSLYRQGLWYYSALPEMKEKWLKPIMKRFDELVAQQQVFAEIFGVI